MIVWGGSDESGTRFQHRREILRAIWRDTYTNTHSYSYAHTYTDTKAFTNTKATPDCTPSSYSVTTRQ